MRLYTEDELTQKINNIQSLDEKSTMIYILVKSGSITVEVFKELLKNLN